MNKNRKNLLVFGYGLAFILAFIGGKSFMAHGFHLGNRVCFITVAFLLVITLLDLPVLEIIYGYWMKGAHFVGHIMTLLLLSAVFYVVFGTVGVILRVLGKDLLEQKIAREKKSYWQPRLKGESDKKCYTKQF